MSNPIKYRWYNWTLKDWFVVVTVWCLSLSMITQTIEALEMTGETIQILHREAWRSQTGKEPETVFKEAYNEALDAYDDWRWGKSGSNVTGV